MNDETKKNYEVRRPFAKGITHQIVVNYYPVERNDPIRTTIAPWMTVQDAYKAADFYQTAFDAVETYRLEIPGGGLVVKLSVGDSEFWISSDNSENADDDIESLGGGSIRMILTVNNPEKVFIKALEAGASEVFPISDAHGWKLGRLIDPFGLHWEIGHPLE